MPLHHLKHLSLTLILVTLITSVSPIVSVSALSKEYIKSPHEASPGQATSTDSQGKGGWLSDGYYFKVREGVGEAPTDTAEILIQIVDENDNPIADEFLPIQCYSTFRQCDTHIAEIPKTNNGTFKN